MKKSVLFFAVMMMCAGAFAETKVTVLDLSQAKTALEFNQTTGAWTETYDDETESIESQCFSFVHSSINEWQTWWGFTASTSADNAFRDNFIKYQFSNMAKGGIALESDGSVKTDEFGAPVTDSKMPYLVAFYSPYMAARPVTVTFNNGKVYQPVGIYVNLNSYAYYTIQDGDSYARAFTNGDRLTLTVHGVAVDESEKEVSIDLASSSNGMLTVSRGWTYIDLSELGTVNELYFTLTSTDSGVYGANTPLYFCMDKLSVRESDEAGITNVNADGNRVINYDRMTKCVSVSRAEFAVVYDTTGRKVMMSDCNSFSIEALPAGVYIVKAGSAKLKIAK